MVDARVSGARAERRAGSSPVLGTMKEKLTKDVDFSFFYVYYLFLIFRFSFLSIHYYLFVFTN